MVTSHLGEFSALSFCLVHSRLEGEEVSNPETPMNEKHRPQEQPDFFSQRSRKGAV